MDKNISARGILVESTTFFAFSKTSFYKFWLHRRISVFVWTSFSTKEIKLHLKIFAICGRRKYQVFVRLKSHPSAHWIYLAFVLKFIGQHKSRINNNNHNNSININRPSGKEPGNLLVFTGWQKKTMSQYLLPKGFKTFCRSAWHSAFAAFLIFYHRYLALTSKMKKIC